MEKDNQNQKHQIYKEVINYLESGIFPETFKTTIKDSFKFKHSEKDLRTVLKFLKKQKKLVEDLKDK